jgi:mannan endo-1,4-beta-mannosidase
MSQWDVRDYAIYAAGKYGLRIILPLVDNFKYYHGSKYDFIKFRFADTSYPGDAFYGNRAVIGAFTTYIQQIVTRVNPYNGLRYADDPTILAFETGNELGG